MLAKCYILLIIFLFPRDTIEIKSNDFLKVLAVVGIMAFIMVSVAYGITYMFSTDRIKMPIEPYHILFIFSIGFVLFSVFFEKERQAVYPWSLLGGAVASAIFTFIITSAIGGMKFIAEKGFIDIGTETWFYALSIAIILSMVLLNLVKHKL